MTRVALGAVLLLGAWSSAWAQGRTMRLASEALGGGERIFSVLLPAGYAESDARYPVLYLLHGGGQDHTAFMARKAFVPAARRHAMIVVMPAADRSYSAMSAEAQARYETFLATELVPHIDAQFRTTGSAGGRAIGGISQGGGIAARTAFRYPHVYGAVGALSPAFRGAAEAGEPPQTHFYVSCGGADPLLPASRRLAALLQERKIPHEFRELQGGDHSWRVWDQELVVWFDMLGARDGWRQTTQR